jgi:hypothetical protein
MERLVRTACSEFKYALYGTHLRAMPFLCNNIARSDTLLSCNPLSVFLVLQLVLRLPLIVHHAHWRTTHERMDLRLLGHHSLCPVEVAAYTCANFGCDSHARISRWLDHHKDASGDSSCDLLAPSIWLR